MGRGALSRRARRAERGHDLRRGPAPALHLPAAGGAGRRRLARISREPVEETEDDRRVGPGTRPPRARALPVAQPPEPGRLLQRPRRWAPRRVRPVRARLLGQQPAPGGPVGGSGGASFGHPPRRFRRAAPRRARRRAAFRLARLRQGRAGRAPPDGPWSCAVPARTSWTWPGATDILYAVTTADGTPLAVVLPGPRYAEVEDALRKASPSRRGELSLRPLVPPAAPARGGRRRRPGRGPRSGRAGPAAPGAPPAARTTRGRSRTWAAGRRGGRRG